MGNFRPLSDALAKKAVDELNENPSENEFYLNALRQWIKKQPHLRSRTDDQFLISFLRTNKFSLERAKQKLDNFYTLRGLMPELFKGRDVHDCSVQDVLLSGAITPIPEPISEDGPRIILIRACGFMLPGLSMVDIFRVGTLMADLALRDDDHAVVVGYVLILDLANVNASAALRFFDVSFTKKLTILLNKAMPSRMKAFHIINLIPTFEKCFNMIKSVINEKLRNRFYVHGVNLETLYKHVSKDILPVEYGGNEYSIRDVNNFWLEKIRSNEKYLLQEEEEYGVSEELRVGRRVSSEKIFGVEGSFRRLNVD